MTPMRATDLLVRLAAAGLLALLTGSAVALFAQVAHIQPVRGNVTYVVPHLHGAGGEGPMLSGWISGPSR